MSKRARSRKAAIGRYTESLQRSLSTLCSDVWVIAEAARGEQLELFTPTGPMSLTCDGGRRLFLEAGQRFHTYRGDREYRVTTDGYLYTLSESARLRSEIVGWHWHPTSVMRPHLHAGELTGHVPTGRVSFEAVARYLIEDWQVMPARSDWREVLESVEKLHVEYRSWHSDPGAG